MSGAAIVTEGLINATGRSGPRRPGSRGQEGRGLNLLGPNGAGETPMMRTILDPIHPT